jgi:CheY-like chemotaxis protein
MNIPIIAQTAYAMESDKLRALDAGCNDYISKPYISSQLNALVRKYLPQNDLLKSVRGHVGLTEKLGRN